MSGHSKWSSIKHRKGAQDAKRAKIFSKVIKEITVAAKIGGSVVENNTRLRTAMSWARSVNMPLDNVQRAIKKSENSDANTYESIIYEGYGPHSIAVIVECLTDNKNRTAASIRSIFSKNNGNLGTPNSVQYMFDKIGIIEIEKSQPEEEIVEYAIEAGALDIDTEDESYYKITTQIQDLQQIQNLFEKKTIPLHNAEVTMQAQNCLVLEDIDKIKQIINFLDFLEENDDVQKVYSNLEVSEDAAKKIENI